MDNIPENKIETTEPLVENTTEEFSTVFSNPTEHTKKAENVKKKKLLPKIIASLLAVAILAGGTVAVIKLIPKREDDTQVSSQNDELMVLTNTTNDYKSVKVTNTNGTFEFYREIVKKEATDSSSESEIVGNWYLKGYDKEVISATTCSYVINAAATMPAVREITQKTEADCGLTKPSIKVDIVTTKDEEFSILFGSQSPDKSGYYLKLSNSDKIYLVNTDSYDDFVFTALDMAADAPLPTFEVSEGMSDYINDDGTLISFDKMTISGLNFPEPIEIVANKDENLAAYATYMVEKPSRRIADKVDEVFAIFTTGLENIGAYSLDATPASLAKVGLNNPDISIKLEVAGKSMTFDFKLQSDGNYAVNYDGAKLISQLEPSVISFATYNTNDFYSSWVALISIDDLSEFTFKTQNRSYKFGIEKNTDEKAEENYIITYNGKRIPADSFQSFYQDCISISCTDYSVSALSGEAEYSMEFKYKENGESVRVDFVKATETRYQYSINGTQMGKVNSSAIKQLAASAARFD